MLVDGAMERVRAWEAAAAAGSGDAAELELPPCNSFLRRALCERLEAVFPELAVESRAVEGRDRDRKLAVMRLSATQKAEKAARELREKLRRLDDRAGFLRVWRALCTARKPIIGHNCLYDLLFSYAAFEGALPPTVAGWKAALHGVLPECGTPSCCRSAPASMTTRRSRTSTRRAPRSCRRPKGARSPTALASGMGTGRRRATRRHTTRG